MDSQFLSLANSFSTNYVQYRITGNNSYQNSYNAAKQGIETILANLEHDANVEKTKIDDFYKSGIEQQIGKLSSNNRKLQRELSLEGDSLITEQSRNQQGFQTGITTTQYVSAGICLAIITGLSFL
jgi:hypothetical protein